MELFKNFLAFIITLGVFALWILPAFMNYHTSEGVWRILYLPITLITILWGSVMWKKYFNS